MKSQTLVLLVVAVGCGLVAMLGVQQVLDKKGESETRKVQVLQASVDIDLGQQVNETNTQFVSVGIETVPEDAVTELEQITDRSMLIPVNRGDWITQKKLSEVGDQGVSVRIPIGMQVATIPVDATTSHSGMLQPGHRVDLMISYQDQNKLGERTQKVRRILQYVEVFAVDNKVYGLNDDGEAGKAKNISLLVTPEQSLFLELAKTQGRMSTVLRGNGDDKEVIADQLSADELDGRQLPELNYASARDTNRLPESDDSLLSELSEELLPFETGPVTAAMPVSDGTWQIAIWQGTDVRMDTVYLDSDKPIPSNIIERVPVISGPNNFQVPMPSEVPATASQQEPEGVEDTASDLWNWKFFEQ